MKPVLRLSLIVVFCCESNELAAQTGLPQTFGNYYQRHAVQATRTNVQSFLFDKYFYHKPAVSPYLSLSRRGGMGSDAYTANVRPEQLRRQQADASMRAYVQQRKMAGNVGHTVYSNALGQTSYRAPSATPPRTSTGNPYYNQYYGGRR